MALEEKKPEDAKKLAQEAVTELAGEKDVGGEAQGRETLALALLDLGDMAGAGTQIEQATTLAQPGERPEFEIDDYDCEGAN